MEDEIREWEKIFVIPKVHPWASLTVQRDSPMTRLRSLEASPKVNLWGPRSIPRSEKAT